MSQYKMNPDLRKMTRRDFLNLAGLGLLAACNPIRLPAPSQPGEFIQTPVDKPTITPTYFPTDEWRESTPEEQGIDSQAITRMLEKIAQEHLPVHSFVLIRNGYLVTEAYLAPIAREHVHHQYSATKSVTSAMVGIAIQEGYIKGVDQKILDFFPEIRSKNPDERLNDLTIEHLLTMSTGQAAGIWPNPDKAGPLDWVDFFLGNPTNLIVYKPGSKFLYTSGAPHTLSAIIQKTTGKNLAEYAAEKLFKPLGIKNYYWLADQNGITFGNSWLRITPLDMAKFGYLYLNNGTWDGQQIIPQAWVEQSTKKHIDTKNTMFNAAEEDGYGYLWWMNSFGGFSAHGMSGQFIFVIPESNLIAVFTGSFEDPEFDTSFQFMKDFILPAVMSDSPITKNDQAYHALSSMVSELSSQTPKPLSPLPDTARRISGKTIVFDPKVTNEPPVTFYFNETAEYTIKREVSFRGEKYTYEFRGGLDDVFRLNPSVDMSYGDTITGYKGYWEDKNTFIIFQYSTDSGLLLKHLIQFDGEKAIIELYIIASGKTQMVGSAHAIISK